MSRVKFVFVGASTLFLVIILSAFAYAQDSIRIGRPIDGSTVRETVSILVPVSTVPDGGFVVYSIDGRFRCAQSTKTSNGAYFVYLWDTKVLDPNTDLPMSERKPRDGRHTIAAHACDASGNKVDDDKVITVYVKNHLTASDIPANGIRLRYVQKAGSANNYKFDCHIDLTKVQGADTNLTQAVGGSVEGEVGTVKKTIEYMIDSSNAFVSLELVKKLSRYKGGRLSPDNTFDSKRVYQTEDTRGSFTRISTNTSGTPVSIELPILPSQKVRIGDVWRQRSKVFWDPATGKSVSMSTSNTFEGLEWQNGHPCAKIRTTFSGSTNIPFSNVFTSTVTVTGETVTYFAYRVGKVIHSETIASAKANVAASYISAAVQPALPPNSALFPTQQAVSQGMDASQMGGGNRGGLAGMRGRGLMGAGMSTTGAMGPGMIQSNPMAPGMQSPSAANPGMIGGPPGMENTRPGMMAGMMQGVSGRLGGTSGYGSQNVDVEFTVIENLELIQ